MRSFMMVSGAGAVMDNYVSYLGNKGSIGVREGLRKVRVCNAYIPLGESDEQEKQIYHVTKTELDKAGEDFGVQVSDHALRYGECTSFDAELSAGDQLRFGEGNSCIFKVMDAPAGSEMILVNYRAAKSTRTCNFLSHVYDENQDGSELAVLNAFQGESGVTIQVKKDEEGQKWTDLGSHNAAHVVPTGWYKIRMISKDDKKVVDEALVDEARFHSDTEHDYGVIIKGGFLTENGEGGEKPSLEFYSNAFALTSVVSLALAFFNF